MPIKRMSMTDEYTRSSGTSIAGRADPNTVIKFTMTTRAIRRCVTNGATAASMNPSSMDTVVSILMSSLAWNSQIRFGPQEMIDAPDYNRRQSRARLWLNIDRISTTIGKGVILFAAGMAAGWLWGAW